MWIIACHLRDLKKKLLKGYQGKLLIELLEVRAVIGKESKANGKEAYMGTPLEGVQMAKDVAKKGDIMNHKAKYGM